MGDKKAPLMEDFLHLKITINGKQTSLKANIQWKMMEIALQQKQPSMADTFDR